MGHWYDKDANPQHTIIGANGKERSTTLRDARKLGYLPSVTGIIDQLDKPALTRWKLDRLADTMTKHQYDEENYPSSIKYIQWCQAEAMAGAIEARNEGERIHKAIEDVYKGEDCLEEYVPHVNAVQALIKEHFGERKWYSEKTFASELGYGGMCDLHCKQTIPLPILEGGGEAPAIVLDFKSKDFNEDKPPKGYPEQAMQLEACRYGLGLGKDTLIGNVFVSRDNAGVVSLFMHEPADYFEQFELLLELWKRRNKYLIEGDM